MNNLIEILFRRKNKVTVLREDYKNMENLCHVATIMKNFEAYGYTFSKALFERLSKCKKTKIEVFYTTFTACIRMTKGEEIASAKVMYPNFPQQIMELDDAELLFNALEHYASGGNVFPDTEVKEREKLYVTQPKFIVLDIGRWDDLVEIRDNLLMSNTSISEQDKKDLIFLCKSLNQNRYPIPEDIPFRENAIIVAASLLQEAVTTENAIQPFIKSATDILRVITYLSGGDISLSQNCVYCSLSRKQRRILLNLLNQMKNLEEDMQKYRNRWIRIGEKLHPQELLDNKSAAVIAFNKIRNHEHIQTFSGEVQKLIDAKEYVNAAYKLSERAGEFARRLDELLRKTNKEEQEEIISIFQKSADKISSRVLLQLLAHFCNRTEKNNCRVVLSKGDICSPYVLSELEPMQESIADKVINICNSTLINIYSKREPFGKVYIDPKMSSYVIPYSQRSASKVVKTLTRGSRIGVTGNIIRAFIHWTNAEEGDPVDIDLSVCVLDKAWDYLTNVSFTSVKNEEMGIYHSGDITNGGDFNGTGVAEFIDIDLEKAMLNGARYLIFEVHSYSGDLFSKLPHVSFGWMQRDDNISGEIFEPSTVEQKMDLTVNSTSCIPVIFDCIERNFIWCDMAFSERIGERRCNMVENTLGKTQAMCYAMVNNKKVDMYYLAYLHGRARGEIVDSREEADIIFSNDITKPLVEVEDASDDNKNKLVEKDVKIITAYDIDEFYVLI